MPSTGRHSEAFSQEIVPIHQGRARERVSLYLALVLNLLAWRHFPASSVGAYARGGPCDVCLLYQPTGAREGEDQKPGERHHASCPDLLRVVPDPYHALGRGWMGDGGRWKKIGTCWESTSSLERGAGADKNGHIPEKSENHHVRMRSCQNASSSLHNLGAGLLEVWCRILGGGGEMISLADNEFNFFLLCSN